MHQMQVIKPTKLMTVGRNSEEKMVNKTIKRTIQSSKIVFKYKIVKRSKTSTATVTAVHNKVA